MSNEVTKGVLEDSLLAVQDYLDNTSSEQFEEDYLSVQNGVGFPARLLLDLLDTDLDKLTLSPEEIFRRVNGEWDKVGLDGEGCPLDK